MDTNYGEKQKSPPIDVYASDGGSATGGYFRFQYMCTSLIALKMLANETEYKELFCELHEDVVGIKENNQYVGIQIKYHGSGSLSVNEDVIIHTIKKFHNNDHSYPKKFDKFIIISNAEITSGKAGNIKNLLKYCMNHDKNEKIELVLDGIAKKCNLTKIELKQILSKTEYEQVPQKNFLKSHLIGIAGNKIKECKLKNPLQIESIIDSLINLVSIKSQDIPNSLGEYFSFRDNSQIKREHAQILSKRITPDEIKNLIEKSETFVILKSDKQWPASLGSINLIDYKMELGGIHLDAIRNLRILASNAFYHIFQKQYEGESKKEIDQRLEHISVILDSINSHAETKARLKGSPFGLNKLNEIDDKINEIFKSRPSHVFDLSPEILLGLVGLLVMDCSVNFSDVPKGGFI